MNEATIKIKGVVMNKPFNKVLKFIKAKGLDYEIIEQDNEEYEQNFNVIFNNGVLEVAPQDYQYFNEALNKYGIKKFVNDLVRRVIIFRSENKEIGYIHGDFYQMLNKKHFMQILREIGEKLK